MIKLIKIIIYFCTVFSFGSIQTLNAEIAFEDQTKSAGLTTTLRAGYGSAWGDFNGDGWLDIWVGNHTNRPQLYINNGNGSFTNSLDEFWEENSFLDAHGGAWADFDNDGDQDLIELYGNQGGKSDSDKRFYVNHAEELTDEAITRGLNDSFGRGRTPLWLDWNNDGLLDLYMINEKRPFDDRGPTRLMLQQKNGTFKAAPGMTKKTIGEFAQLAYFDSAVHLLTSGWIFYPEKLYRLGDTTLLPIIDKPRRQFRYLQDTAVADFDGNLEDNLLVLQTPTVNSWKLTPTNRQVSVAARGLSSIEKGSLNFWLQGSTRLTIRIDGAFDPWTADMIHVGKSGSNLAKLFFTVIEEEYQKRYFIKLELDAANPEMSGMVPLTLRTLPGIYVGWLPHKGLWRIEIRGTSTFRAKFRAIDAEFEKVITDEREFWNKDPGSKLVMLSRQEGKFIVDENFGYDLADSCHSVAVGDFDNDMDLDVYLTCANGLRNRHNVLLENIGGSFVPVPDAGGASTINIGSGGKVSVADYDNDGYLDLLVTDGGGLEYPFNYGRQFLLRNKGGSNHWLKIDLIGCQSNRDGIGARVVVTAGGKKQARLQAGGIRNGVQDDRRLHFGLANNLNAESVIVKWPSGTRTNLTGLTADKIHVIREDPGCARL
ncbi:CRTAC1 family protein [Nitrosomonas ureae]|uniref:Repeat domain-containing protein n=1 Tax=Nitrosomonas ureae TaxID=44577 RepID=A0A1H9CCM2_9PROT|nr:CRTAC1 family protein [Nitrosomonas ureae]SEP98894.1 Repeat domain-containing protein [Nitrosomonas ureae]